MSCNSNSSFCERNLLVTLDEFKKLARQFKSKTDWLLAFEQYSQLIENASCAKFLGELFQLLQRDVHSKFFGTNLWMSMLKGCFSAWDLELAKRIFFYCKNISDSEFIEKGVQILLELGLPAEAREQAQRLLRQSNLDSDQLLRAELLLCNCFAEEGKHNKASKFLKELELRIIESSIVGEAKAILLMQVARLHYFLGQYDKAAAIFDYAGNEYSALSDWEAAAKSFYNAAACYDNAGENYKQFSAIAIKRTRQLAQQQNLVATLAYCDTYDALLLFHEGKFERAIDLFKRALELLPESEQSYRRIHILSMLAFSYLNTGQLHFAQRFAEQTFQLAESYQSSRFKKRFEDLRAELLWELGEVVESQRILYGTVVHLAQTGVNTIEEFLAYNRYSLQAALIGEAPLKSKINIESSLTKNPHSYLSWLYPQALLKMNLGFYDESRRLLLEIVRKARQYNDSYHEAWGIHGLLLIFLSRRNFSAQYQQTKNEFFDLVQKIGKGPLISKINLIMAVEAYNKGDITNTSYQLQLAQKNPRASFADSFVTSAWLATLNGKSPKLSEEWQLGLVKRFTRCYFAPTAKLLIEEKLLTISDVYTVDFKKQDLLFDVLVYLYRRGNSAASMSELQVDVWKESINAHGWQQKIRNAIQRIRGMVPYTVAPMVLNDFEVRLFNDAIDIGRDENQTIDDRFILQLLTNNPMSALQLSEKLSISLAATKRQIQKLKNENQLLVAKSGRQIFYSPRNEIL